MGTLHIGEWVFNILGEGIKENSGRHLQNSREPLLANGVVYLKLRITQKAVLVWHLGSKAAKS